MRNKKTSWNRSYKDAQLDTNERFERRMRANRMSRGPLSPEQLEAKERFSKHFRLENRNLVRPARNPHEDDAERWRLRKAVEAQREEKQLKDELKEVWEL